MKRTKILATLGPATDDPQIVERLIKVGANAFRINMSHGNHDQWKRFISYVRNCGAHIPMIMDTKGPEMRLNNVAENCVLNSGDEYIFATHVNEDIPYVEHAHHLAPGQMVLFDDGAITAQVVDVADGQVKVKALDGGVLSNKRKVTIPDTHTDMPILSDADYTDLALCKELGIEVVALSFTRSAADVAVCREAVGEDIMIIAKIENTAGVENFDEILEAADGIMVARGDLGVEISLEEVPLVQKKIINAANRVAKPVIVATQMLESMIVNNRPTRAEASDVANAIMDGADCLMLSGETATGKYPVDSVQTMTRIAEKTDPTLETDLDRISEEKLSVSEAISNAVYDLSLNLPVQHILTATSSGWTARMVSRFRPSIPIIAVAHEEHVLRQLQLSWGVQPCLFETEAEEADLTILCAVRTALEHEYMKEDDWIIATAGLHTMQSGATNLIEVHHIKDMLEYHGKN